jgi:eukaryotic-like serine/threonine-protein kinase
MLGQTISHYKIVEKLGAGGMGEVYRAQDAKLGRDVALKMVPEAFARDAERMARFQREAKVLASLNHPNIAAIYGFEDSNGAHALVMELVEGPTLADRIQHSPIPVDEALRIAKQICEALKYAHERGIVPRDLKPANIKVTNDDAVKVLRLRSCESDRG